MGKHRKRLLDGGLVFFFASALTRRCKSHYAINEAIDWLEEQGHTRQARQLLEATNAAREARTLNQPPQKGVK